MLGPRAVQACRDDQPQLVVGVLRARLGEQDVVPVAPDQRAALELVPTEDDVDEFLPERGVRGTVQAERSRSARSRIMNVSSSASTTWGWTGGTAPRGPCRGTSSSAGPGSPPARSTRGRCPRGSARRTCTTCRGDERRTGRRCMRAPAPRAPSRRAPGGNCSACGSADR